MSLTPRRPARGRSAILLAVLILAPAILPAPAAPAPALDWRAPGAREVRAFRDALTKGDLSQIRTWLDEGLEVDVLFPGSNTDTSPLVLAVVEGKIDAVKLLLEAGAEPDRMTVTHLEEDGSDIARGAQNRPFHEEVYAPLMFAAAVGSPEIAAELLARGADVNQRGEAGVTALMVAGVFNRPAIVKLLLEKGAEINAALEDVPYVRNLMIARLGEAYQHPSQPYRFAPPPGATALWMATFLGRREVVDALLAAGADREAAAPCADLPEAPPGEETCTPALLAGILGHREISAALGAGGAAAGGAVTLRASSPEERRELWKKIGALMEKDDAEGVKACLEAGLRVSDELLGPEGGETLLTMAAGARKAVRTTRMLIAEGADVNQLPVEKRWTPVQPPLIVALQGWGCEECARALLDARADVNLAGSDGIPAIAFAAASGQPGILARLLDAGAEVNAPVVGEKNFAPYVKGATPLWIAASEGNLEAVRFLLGAGADADVEAGCAKGSGTAGGKTTCTPRRIAELQKRTKVVALFDELLGASPRTEDADLLDPALPRGTFNAQLMSLLGRGDAAALKDLLSRGLDADTDISRGGLLPALSVAVLAGKNPVVTLLLEHGADPERMSRNRMGETIGRTGFMESIELRARDGDDPRTFLPVYSPLMYAAAGNLEAVELLLKAKADVNARGVAGITALMIAAETNRAPIVKRLLAAGADLEARTENREGLKQLAPHRASALWLACSAGAADAVDALLAAGADALVEAECRAPRAGEREAACDCRRIAELQGRKEVLAAFDRRDKRAR